MPFILAYPDLIPNLLPIKKLAKHQERAKMTIQNIFADTLCNLYDAPICFALMVSLGDYIVVVKKMLRYANVFFYNHLCRTSEFRNIIMENGIK
jgi:hypothetical protein